MCELGRDLDGADPAEYCDNLLLEACDIGRPRVLRRDGVEVANGGKAAWLGLCRGDEPWGCGDATEEASVIVAVAVIPRGVFFLLLEGGLGDKTTEADAKKNSVGAPLGSGCSVVYKDKSVYIDVWLKVVATDRDEADPAGGGPRCRVCLF